jgi:hypothetical protein
VKYLSSKTVFAKYHDLKLPERADSFIKAQRSPILREWAKKVLPQEGLDEEVVAKKGAEIEKEFPFVCYAVSSWAYHANIAENEYSDQERDLLKFYQEIIDIPFKKLGQVRIWVHYDMVLRPTTLLHIASGRHLTRLVELIIKIQNNLKNTSVADDIRQYEMPDTVGINMAIHGMLCETPLQLAAREGYDDVVELLLKHCSIDVNVQDWFGVTALFSAVQHRHEEILGLLLRHRNVDVNAQDWFGETALLLAVEKGLEGIVRVLLETRKADIEVSPSNRLYGSPLITAVEKGHWTIVELLLKFRGKMSEADKQVARALDKLSPDERSNMNEDARLNYGQEVIAQEQIQTKTLKFPARRKRFREE